jgi:hypothetical protein
MTEHAGTESLSLTGVWQGTYYYYPLGSGAVTFTATLIEYGVTLAGTTHEADEEGADVVLCATVAGSRLGRSVVFVKTYEAGKPHSDPIEYDGVLSSDGTEIAGRWLIPMLNSGTFRMIRPARKVETVSREQFVPA